MRQNLLLLWMSWLHDLGGTYEPTPDLSERKPGGRRDVDRRPRQYELDPEKYGVRTNGSVVRL